MQLTTQTTITWNSLDDMQGNVYMNQTRANQLQAMVANNQTDGVVVKSNTANSGTIKFVDVESAQTWITFVQSLATEHNKNIVSTSVTTL